MRDGPGQSRGEVPVGVEGGLRLGLHLAARALQLRNQGERVTAVLRVVHEHPFRETERVPQAQPDHGRLAGRFQAEEARRRVFRRAQLLGDQAHHHPAVQRWVPVGARGQRHRLLAASARVREKDGPGLQQFARPGLAPGSGCSGSGLPRPPCRAARR